MVSQLYVAGPNVGLQRRSSSGHNIANYILLDQYR
jgi:hypothetical protein